MVDVRAVITSFFIMLKEDTYVLIRIESLVALVTVMFILDIFRLRSHSSILTTILKTVDDLSDHIVVYLIGAMQSADFTNQMFPVWAIVLVSLRASLGYLSGYGVPDRERRLTEVGNVIKFVVAGVMNGTRGLEFNKPLWSLWAILVVRSMYRCSAHHMAIKSLWHGRSSEFLPEYMRDHANDREQGNSSPGDTQQGNGWASDCGQRRVNSQKYLVYGESNKKVSLKKPRYTLHLEAVDHESLITLDKVSECIQQLLSSNNSSNRRYEDMSLAFTLSRLLRCRLEDVTLYEESIRSTQRLITSNITDNQQTAVETEVAVAVAVAVATAGETVAAAAETMSTVEIDMVAVAVAAAETAMASATAAEVETAAETVSVAALVTASVAEAERAFKILELELAFVRDYFYTLYPMVFWRGLCSLCISLLLSMATFGVTLWLAVDIRKVYRILEEDSHVLWVHGWNVDVIITWLFLSFMMLKEVWEMVTYLLSNWTRLLLVCKYVQNRPCFRRHVLKLISSFFESKIAGTWHGRIDQYDFLQSCNYKPSFWKLANAITLGKTPEKLDGKKSGKAIKIPECVKPAILQELRRIGLNNTQLPREIPSLNGSVEQWRRYSWACLDLDTCSQVILVWHIATSLCEIKLAQECEIDLTNPGFMRSAWSYLKTISCCTSKPFLVNENIHLTGELKTDYHTATSLSRYCAYLQAFRSELLPDSFMVPDLIFAETLQNACEQLNDSNLILCTYDKLMVIAQKAEENNQEAAQNDVDRRLSMNIVQQGATLGKDLIEMEDTGSCWKILAGVWADLLVHIAPSWNAEDHKNNLESGGEFLTLIWALLWHCGIEKSKLWDKYEVSERNPQVHQETETSNIQPMEEQPDEDGTESDQEPETSNLRRRREHRNNHTDTANPKPNGTPSNPTN